jgi:hypothetical protein
MAIVEGFGTHAHARGKPVQRDVKIRTGKIGRRYKTNIRCN